MKIVIELTNKDFQGKAHLRNLSIEQRAKVNKAIEDALESFSDIVSDTFVVNEQVSTNEITDYEKQVLAELHLAKNEGGFVYYQIYVNDGVQGFSVPIKIHTMEYDGLVCDDEDVVAQALQQDLISESDTNYIESVDEIDVYEYIQMKRA